jgi:hypothetical protein
MLVVARVRNSLGSCFIDQHNDAMREDSLTPAMHSNLKLLNLYVEESVDDKRGLIDVKHGLQILKLV